MDHDDTDFQSQNFQLAGVGSSKFPSGLRPFALPKLDIEDQLQGHLRFDNLIDSEAFFSVQGHENSWIEVLSTGSSVVDFSSSAAESCSISKTNNVWSEATSTESVEMLLKSVGGNETTGNMDSNAHLQLIGMDSQTDQSSVHPKSSTSPTDSTVVPTEKDQSWSTHSRMTADLSNTESQLEHFVPFLLDKKAAQAADSVAEKCLTGEKLSSSNNTPGSCPTVGNYFGAGHDDNSLDKFNVPSAEVDSKKLNNESFPELAPLQNIYTDSYHFKKDIKESEAVVTPQDSKFCHINENKVEGGLQELQNLSCAGQSLGAVNLSSPPSNETLLSKSSDGLLEAITNPVKMLHRSDDTCHKVNITLQPSFLAVQHGTEGLKSSVHRSNELVVKEFSIGSNSLISHQSEADPRNSNPHPVSSVSPKSKITDATCVPEETNNTETNSTNTCYTYDESKHVVLEYNQGSVDKLKSGDMGEKATGEEIPAVSGSIEQMIENYHEENATDEKDLRTSTVNNEEPFKEGTKSALGDQENDGISPGSEQGGEMPAVPMDSNIAVYSDTVSATEKEKYKDHPNSLGSLTTGGTQDKSGNHPDALSLKCQTGRSSIHTDLIDPTTAPMLGIPTGKVAEKIVKTPLNASDDLNAHMQDAVVAKHKTTPELAEDTASLGTGMVVFDAYAGGVPTAAGTNRLRAVGRGWSAGHSRCLRWCTQPWKWLTKDIVLNHGTDCSPGTVTSQGKEGSSLLEPGNGICTGVTCGSPSVISCAESFPQGGGNGSNDLLDHTLCGQSEDPKDRGASADATQRSKQCCTRNMKSAPGSEETSAAGGDRSFSFETVTENLQAGSSLKDTSDDSKKTSTIDACKEQLSERKVAESSGGSPPDNSNIGGSIKSRSSPPQQHPIPECSDLVNFPFTEAQHLQLRAQIFVYGALIQGTPPGEAYMVAAFGEPVSGGKPTWEAAWRAAFERFQYQKSLCISLETPTSSRIDEFSGSTVPEKASKGTSITSVPASKRGGKIVAPAHPAVTLHSPTSNIPFGSSTFNLQRGTHLDFSQAVSPFAYNSHMRHLSPGVAPWYTQSPGPRSAPWLISPQNLIFDSSMQPAIPTNETANGASSKNISISHTVSSGVVLPSPAPSIVSSPTAVVNDGKQKAVSSSKCGTTSQKPRKRKKASVSPEQQPVIASPQLKMDMPSFTPAIKHTAGFALSGSKLVPKTGEIASEPNYQVTGGMDSEQRIIFSEKIRCAVEQSTAQAKGASLDSMEAVKHKEGVWSNLSTISRNKLSPEVEEKLTSVAAAAEAAVSVAKAAAEAAKMASEAALQAKIMAEETLSSFTSVMSMHHEVGQSDVISSPLILSSSTPASSLKIKDKSHAPGSIISVAREAARKRVEEASAAAKRAENLDAILKAAELAAEAVFRAGTIIGMGEPLPFTLRELLEAGPNGYWKSASVRNKSGSGNDNLVTETLEVDAPANPSKSGRKRGRKPKYDQALPNSEPFSNCKELQPYGIHSGHGVVGNVPVTVPMDGTNVTSPISIVWNGIEKGSAVEVLSDKVGFGVAWFSAKVIDINENNAFVSYDNHNGTGPREEWVPLRQEGDKPPQIRLAHPATLSKFKTRKRRRETAGSCLWVIGDHVDAWVNNCCWREGVISQNYETDETKYVVHFSVGGGGESLVVDAWSLRPSRVWKDVQWIEWSRARERKSKSNKGDSPLEKRQKTDLLQAGGNLSVVDETGGSSKDKNTNNAKKSDELKTLSLSQGEIVFNIGKSVVENKSDALAFKRPGLQKEGSKVVYGVPKHGKKKFMEVSKHYYAGQFDKISEGNASNRFVKHLVTQLPRERENDSKVDPIRGRRVGETRSRLPKPTKSQSVRASSAPGNDSFPMHVQNTCVSQRSFGFAGSSTSTSNNEKSTSEKNNPALGVGFRTEVPSVSELQTASTVPTNRAKKKYIPTVSNINRSILNTSEKANSDSGEPRRTTSDSTEPRRSNRRIQPTSRLLEGLQSSLIISKVPGEKVPRSNYKSASSRGRAQSHG
ncbi:G2484-1 protein [Zea mays]|uniref:G2484-1 protein n=1 Tax=Zea mays TaxID=4577 RepID=A0A1D6P6V0_MAIZE|nr:G2484-1 protein [Zea mays]